MTFRELIDRRFARFLVTGGIAALVNIVSRFFLSRVMAYGFAILTAYLCGLTVAWILARLFVFDRTGRSRAVEALRFALVNVVGAAQVYLVSVGLAEYVFPAAGFTWRAPDVAHIIGVMIPAFTSYMGHKYFSFAPPRSPA